MFFAVAVVTVLFLALFPGSAGAAAPQSASFSLRGSNGFVVDVSSQGGKVTVIASERRPPVPTFTPAGQPRPAGSGNGAASVYSVPAIGAGPGTVDAGLGALGRIAVSFRASGERIVTTLPCGHGSPTRVVRRLGTFAGTIRFQGEQGYTAVAATSARGSVGTPLPADCRALVPASASTSSSSPPLRPLTGDAALAAVDPGAGSSFRAVTGLGGVSFRARVRERNADGVVVVRRAYAGAPLSAFAFNRSLTWAAVTPPAPFSGSARFAAGSRPGWRGGLRVTFPGLSVPLTGAGFRSKLERR
jgi:hypothetical protein